MRAVLQEFMAQAKDMFNQAKNDDPAQAELLKDLIKQMAAIDNEVGGQQENLIRLFASSQPPLNVRAENKPDRRPGPACR